MVSTMKTARKAKPLCALCKLVSDMLKDYFAPYIIVDNHGTNVLCWTMKEAQSWLSYCGSKAFIMETYDYSVLVARKQG